MKIYDIYKIKTLLRKGNWQETENLIVNQIDSITHILQNAMHEDKQTIRDFNEILTVIQQAIECRDAILLCDMLEYELAPFLHTINENEG